MLAETDGIAPGAADDDDNDSDDNHREFQVESANISPMPPAPRPPPPRGIGKPATPQSPLDNRPAPGIQSSNLIKPQVNPLGSSRAPRGTPANLIINFHLIIDCNACLLEVRLLSVQKSILYASSHHIACFSIDPMIQIIFSCSIICSNVMIE